MQVCLIKAQVKSGAGVHSEWWRIRPGFKATRSRWGRGKVTEEVELEKKVFRTQLFAKWSFCACACKLCAYLSHLAQIQIFHNISHICDVTCLNVKLLFIMKIIGLYFSRVPTVTQRWALMFGSLYFILIKYH